MNLENKKRYIYDNIGKLKNHSIFVDIIHEKNISYSMNENGFFINLMILDESEIDIFYKIISDSIYYKNNKLESYIQEEENSLINTSDETDKEHTCKMFFNKKCQTNDCHDLISSLQLSKKEIEIINHGKSF